MPLDEICPECLRLWKEYEDAVRAHTGVVGEYQAAMLSQNSAEISRLDPLLQDTLKRRTEAREAVKKHEATHHGSAAGQ